VGVRVWLSGNEAGRLSDCVESRLNRPRADMESIDFYFDFLSPFAYLACHRLGQIAIKHQCVVNYIPIDLAAAKLAIGNTGPTNRELPVKLKYLIDDLGRWANRYGIPFQGAKNHNSRLLNLGTFFAQDRGEGAAYVADAYRRTWGEGGAPDDENLLRKIASEFGWNSSEFLDFIASPDASDRYEASTENAIRRGVFGVPTMMVGDCMWWGNDRLFMVDEYLSQVSLQKTS